MKLWNSGLSSDKYNLSFMEKNNVSTRVLRQTLFDGVCNTVKNLNTKKQRDFLLLYIYCSAPFKKIQQTSIIEIEF